MKFARRNNYDPIIFRVAFRAGSSSSCGFSCCYPCRFFVDIGPRREVRRKETALEEVEMSEEYPIWDEELKMWEFGGANHDKLWECFWFGVLQFCGMRNTKVKSFPRDVTPLTIIF